MEEGVNYEEKFNKQIFVGGGGQFTNKVTKTLPIILIIFLITFVIGITIAIYNYTKTGNQNTITTGNVSLSFMESTNVINITNALPMGDVEGKVLDKYFDFSVTTNLDSVYDVDTPVYYEIELEPLSVDSGYTQLSNNQIKVYLENKDTNKSVVEPLLIDDLGTSTNNENNKMLYYTSHNHKSNIKSVTTNYRLRAWIDYEVDASSWTSSTKNQYKFRININSHGYNVRYNTPEYCFAHTPDDTNMTTTIDTYLCGELFQNVTGISFYLEFDVIIPEKLFTYELVDNPSEESINKCAVRWIPILGDETIALNLCSGEEVNGMTLEALMSDLDQGTLYQAFLSDTGMVKPTGKEYTVTSIGNRAFYNSNLTSVVLPNSVTTIGEEAFSSNNLTSVIIPNSVTAIESGAFAENNLTSVVIPNSVTTIGSDAFSFNNLTNLVIPNSVNTIENSAFRYNNLTSVTIGASIETIGNQAFLYNNLTSVKIKGKSSPSGFASYGTNIWGWAPGYSDANITWNYTE